MGARRVVALYLLHDRALLLEEEAEKGFNLAPPGKRNPGARPRREARSFLGLLPIEWVKNPA